MRLIFFIHKLSQSSVQYDIDLSTAPIAQTSADLISLKA